MLSFINGVSFKNRLLVAGLFMFIFLLGAHRLTACSGVPPFDPSCTADYGDGDLFEDEDIVIDVTINKGSIEGYTLDFSNYWQNGGNFTIGDGYVQGIAPGSILHFSNKRMLECNFVPPAAQPMEGINSITLTFSGGGASKFNNADYKNNVLGNAVNYVQTYHPADFTKGTLLYILPSCGRTGTGANGNWARDRFIHQGALSNINTLIANINATYGVNLAQELSLNPSLPYADMKALVKDPVTNVPITFNPADEKILQAFYLLAVESTNMVTIKKADGSDVSDSMNAMLNITAADGTAVYVTGAGYDINFPNNWVVGALDISINMDPSEQPVSNTGPWNLNVGFNGPEKTVDPGFPARVPDPANPAKMSFTYKYLTPGEYNFWIKTAAEMTVTGKWVWYEMDPFTGAESGPFSIDISMSVFKQGLGLSGGVTADVYRNDITVNDKTPPMCSFWAPGSEQLEVKTGNKFEGSLSFSVVDNNPKLKDNLEAAYDAGACPVYIFYSVMGYDYEIKEDLKYPGGKYPVPVEKFFWGYAEVPKNAITGETLYKRNGDPVAPAGADDAGNPAYAIVDFTIDAEELFKEPASWYHSDNSRAYENPLTGKHHHSWNDSRLKYFIVASDGCGNTSPPYWINEDGPVTIYEKRHISALKEFMTAIAGPVTPANIGTVFNTYSTTAAGFDDYLAGAVCDTTIGVQPGYAMLAKNPATALRESLVSPGDIITNLNDLWGQATADNNSGWEPVNYNLASFTLTGSPSLPPVMNPDPAKPSDRAISNTDWTWLKKNYAKYGYIKIIDDDPPSATINVQSKATSTAWNFCWGNVLWGDFFRPSSQLCIKENAPVYTKTNADIFYRLRYDGTDYVPINPSVGINTLFGEEWPQETLFPASPAAAPLTFDQLEGGGLSSTYSFQQERISAEEYQPWFFQCPGHALEGKKLSFFFAEDVRMRFTGSSRDNINTWLSAYTAAGKSYAQGCEVPISPPPAGYTLMNVLYDGTLSSNQEQQGVNYYIFRTPNTDDTGTTADCYYELNCRDQTNLEDYLKVDFKVMDRKVSVHTLETD